MTPLLPPHPALFVDVDGTLLSITARPADARPDASLIDLLGRLQASLGGALALLTGRQLATVAEMFAPLILPAAGIHGLERWSGRGEIVRASIEDANLDDARAAVLEVLEGEPRLMLEDKGDAFAVHYRAAPERAPVVARKLHQVARRLGPVFHVQPGLFVFELKPQQPNKGAALLSFMAEPPFRGRVPVAIGDDLTDLHAFRAAESLGGMAIAVGSRIRAHWNFDNPPALRNWLEEVATQLHADTADRA
jgi:trehalose 6-phosphate phosphatase